MNENMKLLPTKQIEMDVHLDREEVMSVLLENSSPRVPSYKLRRNFSNPFEVINSGPSFALRYLEGEVNVEFKLNSENSITHIILLAKPDFRLAAISATFIYIYPLIILIPFSDLITTLKLNWTGTLLLGLLLCLPCVLSLRWNRKVIEQNLDDIATLIEKLFAKNAIKITRM
jgi:hypothetical protein